MIEGDSSMKNSKENDLRITLTKIESLINKPTFKYTILNTGEHEQKLLFNTSQKYEYVISGKEGDVIKRYSDDRMFLQVLQEVTIPPKGELSYDISLPSLKNGKHYLTIYSTATNIYNPKVTIEFTIETD